MPKTIPFDAHPERYDDWFEQHEAAHQSELRAIEALLPDAGDGLEIGVGTGRFAAPLGLEHGVDPSPAMRERARERGIEAKDGVAEDLPYPDARFDRALMTTTLCFLDDPPQAFREAHRVLHPGGALVVGFIDWDSPLGHRYEEEKTQNVFYRPARFHAAAEVLDLFEEAGFEKMQVRQTLFSNPETMSEPDPVWEGHGRGGFVVIRGEVPC
ncbi:MAG: class I SAM-dependent methyltransferase [Salinivenus sp.]